MGLHSRVIDDDVPVIFVISECRRRVLEHTAVGGMAAVEGFH